MFTGTTTLAVAQALPDDGKVRQLISLTVTALWDHHAGCGAGFARRRQGETAHQPHHYCSLARLKHSVRHCTCRGRPRLQ